MRLFSFFSSYSFFYLFYCYPFLRSVAALSIKRLKEWLINAFPLVMIDTGNKQYKSWWGSQSRRPLDKLTNNGVTNQILDLSKYFFIFIFKSFSFSSFIYFKLCFPFLFFITQSMILFNKFFTWIWVALTSNHIISQFCSYKLN